MTDMNNIEVVNTITTHGTTAGVVFMRTEKNKRILWFCEELYVMIYDLQNPASPL
jgi:hypothetical protein